MTSPSGSSEESLRSYSSDYSNDPGAAGLNEEALQVSRDAIPASGEGFVWQGRYEKIQEKKKSWLRKLNKHRRQKKEIKQKGRDVKKIAPEELASFGRWIHYLPNETFGELDGVQIKAIRRREILALEPNQLRILLQNPNISPEHIYEIVRLLLINDEKALLRVVAQEMKFGLDEMADKRELSESACLRSRAVTHALVDFHANDVQDGALFSDLYGDDDTKTGFDLRGYLIDQRVLAGLIDPQGNRSPKLLAVAESALKNAQEQMQRDLWVPRVNEVPKLAGIHGWSDADLSSLIQAIGRMPSETRSRLLCDQELASAFSHSTAYVEVLSDMIVERQNDLILDLQEWNTIKLACIAAGSGPSGNQFWRTLGKKLVSGLSSECCVYFVSDLLESMTGSSSEAFMRDLDIKDIIGLVQQDRYSAKELKLLKPLKYFMDCFQEVVETGTAKRFGSRDRTVEELLKEVEKQVKYLSDMVKDTEAEVKLGYQVELNQYLFEYRRYYACHLEIGEVYSKWLGKVDALYNGWYGKYPYGYGKDIYPPTLIRFGYKAQIAGLNTLTKELEGGEKKASKVVAELDGLVKELDKLNGLYTYASGMSEYPAPVIDRQFVDRLYSDLEERGDEAVLSGLKECAKATEKRWQGRKLEFQRVIASTADFRSEVEKDAFMSQVPSVEGDFGSYVKSTVQMCHDTREALVCGKLNYEQAQAKLKSLQDARDVLRLAEFSLKDMAHIASARFKRACYSHGHDGKLLLKILPAVIHSGNSTELSEHLTEDILQEAQLLSLIQQKVDAVQRLRDVLSGADDAGDRTQWSLGKLLQHHFPTRAIDDESEEDSEDEAMAVAMVLAQDFAIQGTQDIKGLGIKGLATWTDVQSLVEREDKPLTKGDLDKILQKTATGLSESGHPERARDELEELLKKRFPEGI